MNLTAKEILDKNLYCTLATVNDDSTPHGSPVFFVADQNSIYWWSAKKSQHSQNIERTGKVFITVFDSHAPEEKAKGVYIEANGQIASDDKINDILEKYNQKAKVFSLTRQNVTGDSPSRLYEAIVGRIWLNSDDEINGNYIDIREEVE